MNKYDDTMLEWKEAGKKEILKTPIATVCEAKCTSSDGKEGKYTIIDANDWVIVVPVRNDKFLMVKQWRHGEKALSIEFPGGVIDKGESPAEGARRELLEETGCTAEKLVYLGKVNPNPAFMSNHVHIFAACGLCSTGTQNLDDDEYLNYFEMSKKEVYEKMGTEEFPHALMSAAIMMFERYEKMSV